MKLRGSTYFFIVIIVILLAFIGLSLADKYLQSKVMPLAVGGISLVLAVIGLVRDIRVKAEAAMTVAQNEISVEQKDRTELSRYLISGAWVAGFVLAIYLAGFLITIPLFIFAYMKSHDTGWTSAVTTAVVTTAIIYGVFEVALRVELYRGLLFLFW